MVFGGRRQRGGLNEKPGKEIERRGRGKEAGRGGEEVDIYMEER